MTSLKAAAAALASSLGEFKFVRVDRLEQALFLFYLKFDSLATWSCQCQKGPKCSSQSGPGAAAASRSRREKGLRPWADHHHRMIGMARVLTPCRRRRLQLHCSTTASACRSVACGDRFRRCAELRPELVERRWPLYWRADRPAAARVCDAGRAATAAGRREQRWACSRSGSA